MNYQKITLVGNATNDAQSRKSKKGDITFTTFVVAVNHNKDRTVFFPVIVFDKAGALAKSYVTKGRQVLVEGRIDVNEKGQYNIVADRVLLGHTPIPSTKESK